MVRVLGESRSESQTGCTTAYYDEIIRTRDLSVVNDVSTVEVVAVLVVKDVAVTVFVG